MSDGLYQPPVTEATILEIGPILESKPNASESLTSYLLPLIGALVSWMLLGISIVQLYVVAASEAWQFLVAGWGRQVNLEFPGWTFTALPIVSSFVSLGVQTFYAWRVWQLGRWKVVPFIIILTALASTSAACAVAIRFAFTRSVTSLHETSIFASCILWLGAAAVTDITIMSSMLWLLYAVKRRTRPFERSDRLIRLTVETGSACAIAALLQLGLFSGMPQTNIHLVIALVLSKIYSNTLMTSLNSRTSKLFSPQTTSGTRSLGFRSRRSQSISGRQLASPSLPPVAIHITHEVAVDRDVADDKDTQNWEIEMDDMPSSTGHTRTKTVKGTAL